MFSTALRAFATQLYRLLLDIPLKVYIEAHCNGPVHGSESKHLAKFARWVQKRALPQSGGVRPMGETFGVKIAPDGAHAPDIVVDLGEPRQQMLRRGAGLVEVAH